MSLALPVLLALAIPAVAQSAERIVAQPGAALADAKRIVLATRLEQQLDTVLVQLSPIFAQQTASTLTSSPQFRQLLAQTDGRARLEAALREEFERAFGSHVTELCGSIALEYARLLSAGDLRAVADFLSAGSGSRWASTLGDTQKAAGAAGGSVGADAGAEAYDAVLKRLDPTTGLLP